MWWLLDLGDSNKTQILEWGKGCVEEWGFFSENQNKWGKEDGTTLFLLTCHSNPKELEALTDELKSNFLRMRKIKIYVTRKIIT